MERNKIKIKYLSDKQIILDGLDLLYFQQYSILHNGETKVQEQIKHYDYVVSRIKKMKNVIEKSGGKMYCETKKEAQII